MTPQNIAADIGRVVSFLETIRSLSPLPTETVDLDVLLSQDGTRVIAALWPEQGYDVELDLSPERFKGLTPKEVLNLGIQYRHTVANRFGRFLAAAARACGRPHTDVTTHVEWSVGLSGRELNKLLNGHDTFALSVVGAVCEALHLEFASDWGVRDTVRLARRVDRSVLASQISRHLHYLTTETLEGLSRKLPKGSEDADQAFDPTSQDVDPPEGRYSALYKALAGDTRDTPTYSVSKIDKILVTGGEPPLPPNARADRSWWAGSGARAKGRPQVKAWWAAGYRIRKVVTERNTGRVSSIRFERLPGRVGDGPPDADQTQLVSAPVDALPVDNPPSNAARKTKQPDDADIRVLKTFLEEHGEADRTQIEEFLRQHRSLGFSEPGLTNLLTRARRQGWIVRHGTRSRPRWVATESTGDRMLWIASFLGFDWHRVGPGPVPQEYLEIVADKLGLDVSTGASLVDLVRSIVESADQRWEAGFVSRSGDEIQSRGMAAVLRAVKVHR